MLPWQTYGIPSISSLLLVTGQISKDGQAGTKRMADTGALLLEAVLNPPASDRAISAIARINYIHDRYRRCEDLGCRHTLHAESLCPRAFKVGQPPGVAQDDRPGALRTERAMEEHR